MWFGLSAAIFANLALLFYVLGFLVRRDLHLRILILIGSGFYILYYYYVAASPLWDAIIASLVIALANVYSLLRIFLDRSTFRFSPLMREVYPHFSTLTPGQFRRVFKAATFHAPDSQVELTRKNLPPDALYFVQDGPLLLQRSGRTAVLSTPQFIGEMSFLRGQEVGASATVKIAPGGQYLQWDRATLQTLMQASQPLENAMLALFNKDLARKLDTSFPDAPVAANTAAASVAAAR